MIFERNLMFFVYFCKNIRMAVLIKILRSMAGVRKCRCESFICVSHVCVLHFSQIMSFDFYRLFFFAAFFFSYCTLIMGRIVLQFDKQKRIAITKTFEILKDWKSFACDTIFWIYTPQLMNDSHFKKIQQRKLDCLVVFFFKLFDEHVN